MNENVYLQIMCFQDKRLQIFYVLVKGEFSLIKKQPGFCKWPHSCVFTAVKISWWRDKNRTCPHRSPWYINHIVFSSRNFVKKWTFSPLVGLPCSCFKALFGESYYDSCNALPETEICWSRYSKLQCNLSITIEIPECTISTSDEGI